MSRSLKIVAASRGFIVFVELHEAVPAGIVAFLARGSSASSLFCNAVSSSTRAASLCSAAASTDSRDASAASRASSSVRGAAQIVQERPLGVAYGGGSADCDGRSRLVAAP